MHEELVHELVLANHILHKYEVLDMWGHVSVRNPDDPERFYMTRRVAPSLVGAGDIIEFDLDSNPVGDRDQPVFFERFIHGETYRGRPDVTAVVHCHSSNMIPYGVSTTPLRAITQGAAFLGTGVPVFDIRTVDDGLDFLISSNELGAEMAKHLGDASVLLLRGHGAVVVGSSLFQAVWRGIYGELNAKQQREALQLGEVQYLTAEEAAWAAERVPGDKARAWEYWVSEVG